MQKLTKGQKVNATILLIWSFVVFPLFTAIFLAFENPIMCSITEMGFDLGYYPLFLTWGISIIVSLLYTFLFYLKESGFRKELKIILLCVLIVVDILFLITGTCSDNPDVASSLVISIHNKSAIAMFIGHFVVVGLVTIFAFFRNKTQALLNLLVVGFILITIVFSYIRVTDEEEFSLMHSATSLCEGYSFALIVMYIVLNYVGNLIFEPTGKSALLTGERNKII